MAFTIASEPNLASMVITADGVWDHKLMSPNGLAWPDGTYAEVKITNRAGAELAVFEAEPGIDDQANAIRWVVTASELEDIPDGANFETFVTVTDAELYDEFTYKVQYGRVVRRQVSFPANPVNSEIYTGALFTDSVGTRDSLGPFWIQKANKTVMHNNGGALPYGMGNDSIFNDRSATHWYSPLKSDSQKVQVSIMKPPTFLGLPFGGGTVVVVLCSNYAMTNWIGIKFNCTNNDVRPVTGNVSGPLDWTDQGTTVGNAVATVPDTYTTWYDYPTNTIKLFKGTSLTPMVTWTDSTNLCHHGEGNRYTGIIYRGDLLTSGPQVTYWSAKDDL